MPGTPIPVLYLDIDGTVRQGKDDALGRFVNGPEDVIVFPEAVEMIRRWKAGGGRVVGVSNQGGIALGILSPRTVATAMIETQRQTGNLFDKILWCTHHPDAKHPEMARCWCRKPSPGLIIEAANALAVQHRGEIYPPYMGLMVGDRDEDERAAKAAGLDFQWAADWRATAGMVEAQMSPAGPSVVADPMARPFGLWWHNVHLTVSIGAVPDGPIRVDGRPRPIGVGVNGYAHPVGESWCSACGQLLLHNLSVGYIAHDDPADDAKCTEPYPGERVER